ncbi:alpha/beta hydrolase [Aquirufa ecclesiirivi]|uniref:Alpha/beta hydrolase n=1 Tax=Aquirufa ecclesiirivi TaxID=2715124 RepID=A0ABT4JFA7_9BACT|nr:alpha/beta hydrolase [Aquirufa ecclesiirivi]MCZ2474954.1 alpha/beta hydrolase [Aquirufa ecclesiirivi]
MKKLSKTKIYHLIFCLFASSVLAQKSDRYFTTSDGVKLHYTVTGQGKPLVIFPGYTQSSTNFEPNLEVIGMRFQVYCLDYRWHGLSEDPNYGVHIERFAKDANEMIADAKIGSFYLLAHSMGNTVAWSYFGLFGQKQVIKYILGDEAPCLVTDPSWTSQEKEMYTGSAMDKDLWTAWRMPKSQQQPPKNTRELMMAKLLTEHLGNDWRDILPTIQVPTLALMAENGTFNNQHLFDYFLKTIRHSELKVIPNAGHGYYATNPKEFNEIVLNYFSSK